MTLRRAFVAVIVTGAVLPAGASADALLYRCRSDVCRAAPNGTAKERLTKGAHVTWLSASTDGSRLGVVDSTFAYVLDAKGRRLGPALPRGGTAVIADVSPDGSQVATVELLPEITPAPVGSPPGSPGLAGFMPYLFLMRPDGSGRDVVARAVVDIGWLRGRLARTDPSGAAPFKLGVCLLATNAGFACGSDAARDPARDLFNPAFSPDGTLVAVASATDVDRGGGEIIVYDVASAKPASSLGGVRDREPTWSPDGRRIAFEHDGGIFVVRLNEVGGGRLLRGRQPVWTTAPACRARPRVRASGRKAVVTACARQPGRLTVTLRRNGKRVARKTVRAATGGLYRLRFSRPAGKLSASARLRQRAATLR
jgi:hypothetical protein